MAIEVNTDGYHPPRVGIFLLYSLVAFLFLLFVLRFWYLQILHGEEYAVDADNNRTREELVFATRGIILDQDGELLAENRPAYDLTLIREDCADIPATLAQVSLWTGTPLSQITSRYQQDIRRIKRFQPQTIAADLSFEQVMSIEKDLFKWQGLAIETRQRRFYPQGPLFAHVLGYVARANEEELKADERLDLGDIVGKQGLELKLEKRLRGAKGKNTVAVDVLGRELDKRQLLPPIAGENITLTLSTELQRAASEALGEYSGSVVVLEPETGKLRALVTHPSYDNNLFTTTLSQKDWAKIAEDPRHPLQNRAIQSAFPPGSVWKLMMAGLFLEQKIDPRATVTCVGQVTVGNHTFRCWKRGGHGTVNMMQSLISSCDVYYYEMAQKVGIDNLERFAKACGFSRQTGIDLPHERSGLVPGRAWKQSRGQQWSRGETLNVSIGQGATLTTPLQMAVFMGALLNEGKILKPSLVETDTPELVGELPIPLAHRNFILESMRITASSGTARRISRPDAVMGGKTGTAQVVKLGERRLRTHEIEYMYRDHAWLVAWGMKDGRTYVVVVMAEHGGGGGATAGPVVKKVFETLFGPVNREATLPPNTSPFTLEVQ